MRRATRRVPVTMLQVALEHEQGAFHLSAAFTCGSGVTALFGQSGAGKTTLVNAIAGLMRPRRGTIAFDGEPLFDRGRGMHVPAAAGALVTCSRRAACSRTSRFSRTLTTRGCSVPSDRKRTESSITWSNCWGWTDCSPGVRHSFRGVRSSALRSAGAPLPAPAAAARRAARVTRYRCASARSSRYLELLRDEVRIPIIYVSHTVEEVVRLADTVVLLSSGKVVAVGDVEEVMGRPDLRPVAGVFEGGAVIDARVTGQDIEYDLATLAFDGGTLTVTNLDALIGEPVRVRVRARDVSIALEPPQRDQYPERASWQDRRNRRGSNGIVDVTIAVGAVMLRSRVTRRAVDQLALAPGLEVYALIKAVSLDRSGGGYAG